MEFRDLSFEREKERELYCFWVLEGGSFLNEIEREKRGFGLDWIWEIRTENEMSFGNWLRIEKCPLCLKDECLVVCYS